MRTLTAIVVLMAFLPGWLRADAYKEQRTGVEFPDTVAGFKRGPVSPYQAEPGRTGVAIAYRADGAEATVYVRASGNNAHITSAGFLKESLAAIKVLESQGKYSNVKIYETAPEKERPGWSSGAFTSRSTNYFLVSFICCKVEPSHMFKIRASTADPKNDKVQSFVKSIQELLDKAAVK